MPGEQMFNWRVTASVELPDSQYAKREIELSGSLMAPPGEAPDFGIEAIKRALEAAAGRARSARVGGPLDASW
jgi:hypothetical protein